MVHQSNMGSSKYLVRDVRQRRLNSGDNDSWVHGEENDHRCVRLLQQEMHCLQHQHDLVAGAAIQIIDDDAQRETPPAAVSFYFLVVVVDDLEQDLESQTPTEK